LSLYLSDISFIDTSKKKESCNRQWYVLYIIETNVQHIEIIRLAIKEKISLKKYNDKEKYFGILSSCSHFELCGRMLIIALNKCQAILFVLDCVITLVIIIDILKKQTNFFYLKIEHSQFSKGK